MKAAAGTEERQQTTREGGWVLLGGVHWEHPVPRAPWMSAAPEASAISSGPWVRAEDGV